MAAAATLYLPVSAGLLRQWYEDPNTAYGPLVLLGAGIAARQRWSGVRALRSQRSMEGAAALCAAVAVYVAATLAADVFLLRLSAVLVFSSTIWFVWGSAYVRALLAPLALCAVAIPPPAAVVTELTMPLQLAASWCAAAVLGLGGADVVREGNVLTLSYITLEVAEACSGMRSLVTLLALIAVYRGTTPVPAARVLLLAAAAVPVALLGNSLRVVATAVLASRIGADATSGVVHDATGFAAFLVMGAALAGVHVGVSRRDHLEVRQA